MRGSLLRNRDGHHAHVGFVELFFDLVFVFAITQISHTLLAHLTWGGALQAGMLLMAVWWAWNFTSWVTNWLDPETTPVRLALFALMAAGLVMSSALPEAFGERGLVFACAFAAIQVGRSLFMLWAAREQRMLVQNFQRILVWLVVSGVLWIAGGIAAPEHRLWFWLGALAIDACDWQHDVVRALTAEHPTVIPAWGFGVRGPGESYSSAASSTIGGIRDADRVALAWAAPGDNPQNPFEQSDGRAYLPEEELVIDLDAGDWLEFELDDVDVEQVTVVGAEDSTVVERSARGIRVTATAPATLSRLVWGDPASW